MTSQLETENQHGMTDLVTGIVDDAQEVIKQEIKLAKVEVFDRARHYSIGAALVLVSIGVLIISGVLFALAAAYCMVSRWPSLPLWGAFTIVGALAVITAAVLALIARAQFTEFNSSDPETEGSRETTQWKTKK